MFGWNVILGMCFSGGGRESKAGKNDKRRRGKDLIKQRVGVGVPEIPAEMEAKARPWRTFYVRRYIIPLESIKGGPELSRCKLSLTSSSIPEPVFSKSCGHVGIEEIINHVIWGSFCFPQRLQPFR